MNTNHLIGKAVGSVVLAAVLVLVPASLVWAQPSQARQEAVEVSGPVPWVSDISGNERSLQVRQSDSDWFEAVVNTPLGEGDQLYQEAGGRSEVYFGRGSWIRLDEDTGVRFDSLKDNEVAVVLTRGSAEVSNGAEVPLYLDVPGQTVILDRGGRARVRVSEDGVTEIAAKRGRVRAHGPNGDVRVEAGQTLTTDAKGKIIRLDRGVKNGRFDNYGDDRDAILIAAARPPAADVYYVPEPVAADFSRHGTWIDDPQYGWVWRPHTSSGWAPYRDGRWVYRPGWGWTWVSYERWGWYPYHYGRWVYVGGFWSWSPVYVRHARWAPALVFWVGGPDYVAWHPYPYGVVYGTYFGPTWHTYVYPHCITVVYHRDFHRGHYDRYARPWNDSYRGHAEYRGYAPRPFNERELRDYRSPRPDGFTAASRVPREDRLYARTTTDRNGRPERVSYGATDRDEVRARGGRPDTGARPAVTRDPRREGGNFNYGAVDRPRPGNQGDRPTRASNQPDRNTDRNTDRPSTDRPRPDNQGNRPAATRNNNSDRPTQPGRVHQDRPTTRPQPDTNRSGSGYRGDSRPDTGPSARPDAGNNDRSGYRGDSRPDTGPSVRPDAGNNDRSGYRGDSRPDAGPSTRPDSGGNDRGSGYRSDPPPSGGERPNTNRSSGNRDSGSSDRGSSRPSSPDSGGSGGSSYHSSPSGGSSGAGSRPSSGRSSSPSRSSRPRH